MQLTQQTTIRTLECVWTASGSDLACVWVERERQSVAPAASGDGVLDMNEAHEIDSEPPRRVA